MLAILLVLAQSGGNHLPDEYLAPRDCWTTRGGGPARCGAALTHPVRGPVEVAWSVPAGGEIEGEPLAWQDLVVISVRKAKNQRVLQVLDLTSGATLASETSGSTSPLEPSLWGNVLVYRAAPDVLRAVRIGNRSMTTVWRHRSEGLLGPPLLVGDEVYVTSTTGLCKFKLGHRTPIWTVEGSFEGPPALGPDGVRALAFTPRRAAMLKLIEPSRGTEMVGLDLGGLGKDPDAVHPTSLALLASSSFIEFSAPVLDQSELRIIGMERADGGDGRPFVNGLTSLPAAVGAGWIGRGVAVDGEYLLRCDGSRPSAVAPLASRTDFPRLFDGQFQASVCGSVAYIGTLACDLGSSPGQEHVWGAVGRVLWRIDGLQPSERPVPARETVLYVDQAQRLVAVRARAVRGHQLVGETKPGPVSGTMVLRDGTIESGEFTLDPAGQRVQRSTKAKTESWPFAEVLLLEDAEGNIGLAGDPLRGLDFLAEGKQAAGYLELAKRAQKANDPELLECLVDEAVAHGVDEDRSPGGETSLRLDLVAYADASLRMPWATFFAESNVGFYGWRYEGPPEAPSSIFLGQRHIPSAQQMFYAQAAATTRYLYEAQGGALRPKLFAFLRAYYTGDRAHLDLPAALGVEADELGRAIVDHARSVLKGAR